ncbi:MAG: Bax inhibitor-1/YccA family protein [Alphaproteobacteria bacterium]|nr:Bax inhibitor-1/YccA family protein [Alphaproteobacteria bacterium]MBM3733652.1 Bax inhibitor-1/YccA family protein [Acidimicrobiia bacterium]
MARDTDKRFDARSEYMSRSEAELAHVDVGLRQHMLKVYNYMASGLTLTGMVAYAAGNSPAVMNLLYAQGPAGQLSPTILAWIVMLAPIGMVFFLAARIHAMQAQTAQTMFWVYSALMGLSLANIFLVFTGASIARVFFITAGTFAGMSLYGYTTKRDLSRFGSFLFMGLIGVLIAAVVNLFLASSALHFVVSVVGVLVFIGLTAYDTQEIKSIYLESDSTEVSSKKAILGALKLYLDFINIFVMLIQLFGERR